MLPCPLLQEATDIYKRLLLEHRDFLALNVYVALCYARLDYYDVSQVGAALVLDSRAHGAACACRMLPVAA